VPNQNLQIILFIWHINAQAAKVQLTGTLKHNSFIIEYNAHIVKYDYFYCHT
jgi:hypothetical protein